MLNPEFFPTPEAVIRHMLTPWLGAPTGPRGHYMDRATLAGLTILEPSAGSGAILDFIVAEIERVERGSYERNKRRNLYACEIDPDLKATLHGKDYKVIADDFLRYQGDHQFDLIVLNPPFSCGDKHTVHAYEKVAPGGHVVALVNAETIRNPYTETRQLLAKLIADYGSSEDLGRVFERSERPTSVEVVMIRLQKPASVRDPLSFNFGRQSRQNGPQLSEETFADKLALNDVVGNMILGYEEAKAAFIQYAEAREKLRFFGAGVTGLHQDILEVAAEAIGSRQRNPRASYNDFSDVLKQAAWREVMGKLNIQKYLTQDVRNDYETYGRHHGFLEFTKENVGELLTMIFENRASIMERAVESVFDIFTEYHAENRCYVEGWKTNSKYKVNRKIILPRWVRWDDWRLQSDLKRYGSTFRVSHSLRYDDIDRVMCYLTGTEYTTCWTIEKALERHFHTVGKVYPGDSFADTLESEFFDLRFFKKGTLHLTFKDARLHQEFNLRACAGKQWLPEPEMRAYRQRKRGPFDPEPAAVSLSVAAALPASTGGTPGQQAELFPAFAQAA